MVMADQFVPGLSLKKLASHYKREPTWVLQSCLNLGLSFNVYLSHEYAGEGPPVEIKAWAAVPNDDLKPYAYGGDSILHAIPYVKQLTLSDGKVLEYKGMGRMTPIDRMFLSSQDVNRLHHAIARAAAASVIQQEKLEDPGKMPSLVRPVIETALVEAARKTLSGSKAKLKFIQGEKWNFAEIARSLASDEDLLRTSGIPVDEDGNLQTPCADNIARVLRRNKASLPQPPLPK